MTANQHRQLQELKSLTKRWKAFPNLSTKGFYEPFSQTVVFNSIEIDQVKRFGSADNYQEDRDLLRLVVHELTHWADHVATLWGQRLLVQVFDGIHARLTNNTAEFWRVKQMASALARIHLPAYYAASLDAAKEPWNGQPWRMALTAGCEFGADGRLRQDRPLVFVRFQTSDGRDVVRVPLTIASLTETSAMASEMLLDVAFLQRLPERQRAVEQRLIESDYKKRLYTADLGVYSVVAHFVANQSSANDIVLTYLRSARLATLCLNLPPMAYDLLRTAPPNQFERVHEAVRGRLAANDPGFAFAIIAACGPRSDSMSPEEWVAAAARAAGLPQFAELDRLTCQEMDGLRRGLQDGPEIDRLRVLLEAGSRTYARRGFCGENTMSVVLPLEPSQESPPIMLGSGELFQLGQPIPGLADKDHEAWYERAFKYELRVSEFLEACLP